MMKHLRIIVTLVLFTPFGITKANDTSEQLSKDQIFTGQLSTLQLRKRGFLPLFSEGSLEQWEIQDWHRGHWVVKDHLLTYDGKARHEANKRADLWTKNRFGDCVVYVEWRLPMKPRIKPHPVVLFNGDFLMEEDNPKIRYIRDRMDAGDSGLYFRGSVKCQANIWSQSIGSGEINGYRTDQSMPPEVRRGCIPLKNVDHPFGHWNSFLVTLQGSTMSVQVNGEIVIPQVTLPELPASGPIALQHHGDPVEFRQIWIKSLD